MDNKGWLWNSVRRAQYVVQNIEKQYSFGSRSYDSVRFGASSSNKYEKRKRRNIKTHLDSKIVWETLTVRGFKASQSVMAGGSEIRKIIELETESKV